MYFRLNRLADSKPWGTSPVLCKWEVRANIYHSLAECILTSSCNLKKPNKTTKTNKKNLLSFLVRERTAMNRDTVLLILHQNTHLMHISTCLQSSAETFEKLFLFTIKFITPEVKIPTGKCCTFYILASTHCILGTEQNLTTFQGVKVNSKAFHHQSFLL